MSGALDLFANGVGNKDLRDPDFPAQSPVLSHFVPDFLVSYSSSVFPSCLVRDNLVYFLCYDCTKLSLKAVNEWMADGKAFFPLLFCMLHVNLSMDKSVL